jgi:DNA-binding transcriptional regulator YdaS (Cro superfamily)
LYSIRQQLLFSRAQKSPRVAGSAIGRRSAGSRVTQSARGTVKCGKQRLLPTTKQLLYDASMSALQVAIESAGGQAALAQLIGVKQQHVWNWLNRGNSVPPEHCAAIEQATSGAVTRRELRPDDWRRIWPELAEARDAA